MFSNIKSVTLYKEVSYIGAWEGDCSAGREIALHIAKHCLIFCNTYVPKSYQEWFLYIEPGVNFKAWSMMGVAQKQTNGEKGLLKEK